jgi:hypothetical protein
MRQSASFLLIALILCTLSLVFSATFQATAMPNAPTLEWDAAFGGLDADFANDVQPTSDGGYIVVGVGSQGNNQNMYVVKTDSLGQLLWQHSFSLGNHAERAYSVLETQDGGYLVLGSAYLPAAAAFRPWLVRLNSEGSLLWSTENGLTTAVTVRSGIVRGLELADGRFLIAGASNSFSNVQEPWIMTVTPTGDLESLTLYDPLAFGYGTGTYFEDLIPTADGGFALVGVSSPPATGEAFLWKFDAAAQPEWSRLYGVSEPYYLRAAFGVTAQSDGGYLLAGCELPNCNHAMLLKTDAQGDVVWTRQYLTTDYSQARAVLERDDGSLLLLRVRYAAAGSTSYRSELLELDADGALLSVTPIPGGAFTTSLTRLRPTLDGAGFVAAGNKSETNGYALDMYLIKGSFAAGGNTPPTAVADAFTTSENSPLILPAPGVLGNDSDADGDELTAVLIAPPAQGELELWPDGSFSYTPTLGFAGQAVFLYRAADGSAVSATTPVTITVQEALNNVPNPQPDNYETPFATPLVVTAPGVLSNDSDPDGDALTAVLITPPAQGELELWLDGSFNYTPTLGFFGDDFFAYAAADGTAVSAPVTVTLRTGPPAGYALAWEATFGDVDADLAYDVWPTSDGGFLATGVGSAGNLQSLYVVKTDALGQLLWQQTFSLSNYREAGFSAMEAPDGGYVLIGSAYLPSAVAFRPWLLKLDAAGNLLWSTENGLTQTLDVDSAVVRGLALPNGNIVVVGGSNTFSSVQEPWRALVTPQGELFSFTPLPPLVTDYGAGTFIEAIAPTADGGFVLAGTASPPLLGYAFLWKFSATAEPQWAQLYGAAGFRVAHGVRQTADGGYILTGCELPNCTQTMVVKTDAQGQPAWVRSYAGEGNTRGTDVVPRPAGGYLLAQLRQTAVGAIDVASDLLELDEAGNVLTAAQLGSASYATQVARLRLSGGGDGFVLAGYRRETASVAPQLYLARGLFVALPPLPPQAMPDSFAALTDTPLTGHNVLWNDHDANGDALTAVLVSDAAHGALQLWADGTFSYHAPAAFVGVDTFSYRASDGLHMSAPVLVTLEVTAVADPPPTYSLYLPFLSAISGE